MIYDVRTYDLTPWSVPEFERRFGQALPEREKLSRLGAFWHTDVGPLNRVVHVWPYESFEHMRECRAAAHATGKWPADVVPFMQEQLAEIMIPAPFMPDLKAAKLGPIYEMHTSILIDRTVPMILERWSKVIGARTELSPLVACWYSELGRLNRFVHIWAYKDHAERTRVAAAAKELPDWPPAMDDVTRFEESAILLPASFSPLA